VALGRISGVLQEEVGGKGPGAKIIFIMDEGAIISRLTIA
jgi:hypothetical protein